MLTNVCSISDFLFVGEQHSFWEAQDHTLTSLSHLVVRLLKLCHQLPHSKMGISISFQFWKCDIAWNFLDFNDSQYIFKQLSVFGPLEQNVCDVGSGKSHSVIHYSFCVIHSECFVVETFGDSNISPFRSYGASSDFCKTSTIYINWINKSFFCWSSIATLCASKRICIWQFIYTTVLGFELFRCSQLQQKQWSYKRQRSFPELFSGIGHQL